MELADKKCKQDAERLVHYLRTVERERKLKSGVYRREMIAVSQNLVKGEELADKIAKNTKTALSWEKAGEIQSRHSIKNFLNLPKVTIDFEKNMKKRRTKIRKIMMPNVSTQFIGDSGSSAIIESALIESLDEMSSANENGDSNHVTQREISKLPKMATFQSRPSNSPNHTRYLGRPTCVLPPIAEGKKQRVPRSLYQLQFLSKLDENLRAAIFLPKIEHKSFSKSLRSHVTETPVPAK